VAPGPPVARAVRGPVVLPSSWLYVILGNCARRRASTERRSVSLESGGGEVEPDLDESRFFPADHPRWAGMWTTLVSSWDDIPEERFDQLLSRGGRSRPFVRRLRRIELLRHATLLAAGPPDRRAAGKDATTTR
jgi:hypothetical protein